MLHLELAGLGSRMAAAIYDLITLLLLLVIVSLAFSLAGGPQIVLGGWAGAFLVIVSFLLFVNYILMSFVRLLRNFPGGRKPRSAIIYHCCLPREVVL